MRRCARVASAVAGMAAIGWTPQARAELHDAAERVAQAWRVEGATVVLDTTRFLNDDDAVALELPPLAEGACTTIVLVGPRGLGFRATLGKTGDDADPRVESEAGALSIERCSDPSPRRVLVKVESGRGAVETVVARSAKPLRPFRAILPERAEGPAMQSADPGRLPPVPAPDRRADLAEVRAKRDGATVEPRLTWQTTSDGSGIAAETLQPGCHALHLFAPDPRAGNPARRGKLDLDAEMRDASGDRILARDRSDAPDARLAVCVGETTPISVAFVGAPPGADVLVAHIAWPLPAHLPTVWGPEAMARMAHVLETRHVATLQREPSALAQGGAGETAVPVPIEPGACYLAVAAVTQGTARAISVRVRVGPRESFDDRGVDENGALVAFCAGPRDHAFANIDVRGTPLLGWGLALYRLGTGVWELPR